MKTATKKGQTGSSTRGSSTRTKKSRVESEHALMVAAEPPVILGSAVADTVRDTVRDDVAVEDMNIEGAPEESIAALEEKPEPEPITAATTLESEPVVVVATGNAAGSGRPGLLESPLAKRMREEGENRPSRRIRRTGQREARPDLGPEFAAINARIRELRRELKGLRGQKKDIITKAKLELREAAVSEVTANDAAVSDSEAGVPASTTAESGAGKNEAIHTPEHEAHGEDEVQSEDEAHGEDEAHSDS